MGRGKWRGRGRNEREREGGKGLEEGCLLHEAEWETSLGMLIVQGAEKDICIAWKVVDTEFTSLRHTCLTFVSLEIKNHLPLS